MGSRRPPRALQIRPQREENLVRRAENGNQIAATGEQPRAPRGRHLPYELRVDLRRIARLHVGPSGTEGCEGRAWMLRSWLSSGEPTFTRAHARDPLLPKQVDTDGPNDEIHRQVPAGQRVHEVLEDQRCAREVELSHRLRNALADLCRERFEPGPYAFVLDGVDPYNFRHREWRRILKR